MDRVAQLAEEADRLVEYEQISAAIARKATRVVLAKHATRLGFPEAEISSAIDTALGGR